METLATVAFSSAVIAYSVATTQFFLALSRPAERALTGKSAWVMAAGGVLHLVQIVTNSFFTETCPVASMRFALSLAALVTVAAFLIFRVGRRIDALGAFVGPLALLFLVSAQFVNDSGVSPDISRLLLALHVAANLLGLGVVLLAGGTSAFYVSVERRLKSKQLGLLGRLPSLDVLDRMSHRLLLLGFPMLTFGVVSGGLFLWQIDASSLASVTRAALGYAGWLGVFVVLMQRALLGYSGRKSAYGTLTSVALVTLILVVYLLRPVLEGGA